MEKNNKFLYSHIDIKILNIKFLKCLLLFITKTLPVLYIGKTI